LNDLEPQK